MSARRTLALSATAVAACAVALASSAAAGSRCVDVSGSYTEHAVSGPDCTSPVGLCIVAEYRGDLRGTLTGQATSIVPTADTAGTSVALFTTNSQFAGRVLGRPGTLTIRNAGAFRSTGAGSIVDLQTVLSGDGALADVTGEIRASGTFSPVTGGTSEYEGVLCRP